jgi:glycosyltransferase involved in cell wall biosynthesis
MPADARGHESAAVRPNGIGSVMAESRPRVLMLWHSLSGYWAAAISTLAERADVTVLVRPPDPLAPYDYDALELNGAELRVAKWPWSYKLLDELVERTRPDVTCSIGHTPGMWRVLHRARREYGTRTVMFTDNLWFGTPRQHAVQALFKFVRPFAFDRVFVPGVRTTEYVQKLGFPLDSVLTGACTVDEARFASVAAGSRTRWTDPKFLFCGRLVTEKAPDVLAEAYRIYRERVADPWPLQVVGHGPFDGGLAGAPGVIMSDFVQPDALPAIYADAGALILPSRYDSWGVVALEGCTAGLPVVISDGCGAANDMATPANGFVVGAGDPTSLADALTALTEASTDQRQDWGRVSSKLASTYGPQHWADTLLSARRADASLSL